MKKNNRMGNCPLTFCPPSDIRGDGHHRFRPFKPSPDDWASTGRYAAETPSNSSYYLICVL